jgi:hypothetical protein
MSTYTIYLPREDWKKLSANSVQDTTYKNGSKYFIRNKKPYFALAVFDKLITDYESICVRIASTNAHINKNPTRDKTKSMSISGKCKLCARNRVKNNYKIWIDELPADKNAAIHVQVERLAEHSHSSVTESDSDDSPEEDEEKGTDDEQVDEETKKKINVEDCEESNGRTYKYGRVRVEGQDRAYFWTQSYINGN